MNLGRIWEHCDYRYHYESLINNYEYIGLFDNSVENRLAAARTAVFSSCESGLLFSYFD